MAVAVISNAIAVGCLLSAVAAVATVAKAPQRKRDGCDGVLRWPVADGSRDVYCDVVPYVIDVSGVRGLGTLDMSRNDLHGIRVVSDRNVTLPALDLSRNRIPSPCSVSTGRAVRVDSLVLSYNEIGDFSVCWAARNLTLSWNRIRTLNRTDMANASSLEILDLGNNFILWIENDAFAGMTALRWLDLRGNALARISDRTLPSATLRHLDVSGNRGLDRTAVFQPFENLVELNVARNAELSPAVLGSGTRLQALDASHTGLTRVPVTPAPRLRSLTLAGNAIEAVNSGDLDGYPLLRVFNISGNRVAVVEDDAFGRLESLTVLDLSCNSLRSVPRSLPAGLETLDLRDNGIRSLAREDFDGCGRLRTLNVRRNGVSVVQDFTFAALQSLEALDLSENPIKMITREMLTGPARLKALTLERVEAPDTPTFPFTDTRYLNRMRLAHSGHLAAILLNDTAVLSSMFQLEHLDLTGCPAEVPLPSRLPYYMPKMKTLVLSERMRCSDARPWLVDWLCEIRRGASSSERRADSGGDAVLRVRSNRGRRSDDVHGGAEWSAAAAAAAENVLCTRDDDGRVQRVWDARSCAAVTGTSTATTPSSSYRHRFDPTAAAVAVFARFRAKDDANSSSRVATETDRPAAIAVACVALLLVLVACATVWIGVARGDALRMLRCRQSAADVDYQSIEIKSLESLNRVERW